MVLADEERTHVLEATAATVRSCTRCILHANRTNAVPGEGPSGSAILLLGEAPGREEDASGRPFVGRAGRILDAALAAARLPRESVFITNVVKCRPPGNRRPLRVEMEACRPYLLSQIVCAQPRLIVTLGASALVGLLGPGHEVKSARRERLRFSEIPVIATYHPAAVLYNRSLDRDLRRDLRKAARSVREHSKGAPPRRPSGRRP